MRCMCFLILLFHFVYLVTLDETTVKSTTEKVEAVEEYDRRNSYCFQLTWLGPTFDNKSSVNGTCADILDDKRAVGVPCKAPLVVTFDSTPPDMENLWQNYRKNTVCRRAKGHVCAKYSYFFNNDVLNITYMCTKVSVEGEGAVTKGCFYQNSNGYGTEVCVCESAVGYKPCNV